MRMAVSEFAMASPAFVFGWPAVVVAALCAVVGLALRRASIMMAGAFFATPFCCYLGMTPRFRYIGPSALLLDFLGVYAVSRGMDRLAVACALPFVIVAGWLAAVVF